MPTRFEVWKLSCENISSQISVHPGTKILVGPSAVTGLKRLREANSELPVEFFRDEVDNIQSCFLACVDERLAAIAWSYDHGKPAYFLRMSPGDAEIRSVFSLPEFRGRGLAKAVVAAASESLSREGYRRIYAVIHFRNEASQRAFQSAGFSKIAELNRPPIFGPRYITQTGQTESRLGALGRTLRVWRFHPATPRDRQ
ncbi:MAG: GNAT family N-acetyltransferase [Candidatus Acidiferrales bacterium]